MTSYLKSKGYTKEKIASMSDKEVLRDYENLSREFLLQARKQVDIAPQDFRSLQSLKGEQKGEFKHLQIPI